jgi:prophage antirepressor-like protein
MDKDKLMIFENKQFRKVRATVIDGEPWFIVKDVCGILDISNAKDAIRNLDDEKSVVSIAEPHGRTQKINCVSESGLYTLIMCSRKPESKVFRRLITHEVIPSIRKNGAYMTDVVIEHLEDNSELVPDYLNRMRDENAKTKTLRQKFEAFTSQLVLAQPKPDYYNAYISNENAFCFRCVAKELGVSERKLIGYFLENGFLYRDGNRGDAVFPKANKKSDGLFTVRDFHARNGHWGQYTILSIGGCAYALYHKSGIIDFVLKKKLNIVPGVCSAEIASVAI